MARALEEFEIEGVRTLIPFHKAIMASEQWAQARETCRDLIEDRAWLKTLAFEPAPAAGDEDEAASRSSATYIVEVVGQALRRHACTATRSPRRRQRRRAGARPPRPRRERKAGGGGGGGDTLASPLQGNVFKVLVEQGATSRRARSSASSRR